jgi:hypothetical protein
MMPAAWSLRGACGSLARNWHEFFHAPCNARVCAAVRIAFATVVLLNLSILYPDLDRWFTDGGVLPSAVSREIARPHTWSILWRLPSTPEVVRTCYWIAVIQAVLLLVGLLPNIQVLCLFVWLTSFENRNFLINDGEENVFRLLAFLLIFVPIGRAWSVDAAIWRWFTARPLTPDPSPTRGEGSKRYAAPGWGLRLVQIALCLIFLSAGLSKLGGDAWLDGTALYYVARLDDYFGRFPVPDWPFDSPWAVAMLTWSVVAIELLVPALIWFRETRRLCLVLVVLFHLGNEWTMHLFLFHWVMLAGWLAFVSPDDFAWIGRLVQRKQTA